METTPRSKRERRITGRAIRRRRRLRAEVERMLGVRVHDWQMEMLDHWIFGSRNV